MKKEEGEEEEEKVKKGKFHGFGVWRRVLAETVMKMRMVNLREEMF